MSKIKKYTDWRTWWDGLRTNIIKCLGTTGIAFIGTNALAGMHAPIHGIDWEQAGAMFAVHVAFEAFSYMKDFQPQVVVETVDTQRFTKDPATGAVTSESTHTTTSTPPLTPPTTDSNISKP